MLALRGLPDARARPMPTVPHVDLARFMGRWYVIASIPTFIEKDAHNAVERYALAATARIATTFTFRAGGFDGEEKRYTPRGFVLDRASNALWGMQFVWPIKADYRIVYLTADYSQTVIGRAAARLRLDHGAHDRRFPTRTTRLSSRSLPPQATTSRCCARCRSDGA